MDKNPAPVAKEFVLSLIWLLMFSKALLIASRLKSKDILDWPFKLCCKAEAPSTTLFNESLNAALAPLPKFIKPLLLFLYILNSLL